MDNVIRVIPVRDANGDELMLYEYEQAVPPYLAIMGLGCPGATRLALDTGEGATQIDDDTFVLVERGETLTRIR